MTLSRRIPILFASLVFLLSASATFAQDAVVRPAGWDDVSHSNDADLNYEVVFPQNEVNTITITISPENWQAMMDDMTTLYGEFGTRKDGMRGGPGNEDVMVIQPPGGGAVPPNGQAPQGDVIQMGPMGTDQNPIWVTATLEFEGQTWTNVGIRFKGNSSLASAWGSGTYKIPFKLDFDEFEDTYPEIENQRFYGFKELSFSSGFGDESLLHEKVAADIFREAGVPAAHTAFYAVYVDYGEGPIYFGLYTGVEAVEDTVIETQFESSDGNLYKPEGSGATFAEGSFDEESFEKETNADANDYSDILALFEALHADTRTTDPAAWRSALESVFDVDGFVHWLAVNTVIQNWDTYGAMSHNYYLYNDPTTGQLTWIPWDMNEALSGTRGGGERVMIINGQQVDPSAMPENPPGGANPNGGAGPMGGRGGPGGNVTLEMDTVTEDWPLIRYLMDDPVYHALYVSYVEDTINGAFEPGRMAATYQAMHDLIAPYVAGDRGEQEGYTYTSPEAFEASVATLITHVNERYAAAQTFLNSITTGN
jgi:spore coat protein H